MKERYLWMASVKSRRQEIIFLPKRIVAKAKGAEKIETWQDLENWETLLASWGLCWPCVTLGDALLKLSVQNRHNPKQ